MADPDQPRAPPQVVPLAEAARTAATALPRSGGGGRLAENIMHFARTLRAAGLPD